MEFLGRMGFNFALILFVLSLTTGIAWAADVFWLAKRRPAGANDPWWVEYFASFFPVFLAVFFLRSFLVEPFRIPTGSMIQLCWLAISLSSINTLTEFDSR